MAGKTLEDEQKTVQVNFRINTDTKRKFYYLIALSGRSANEFIRVKIDEFIEKNRKYLPDDMR